MANRATEITTTVETQRIAVENGRQIVRVVVDGRTLSEFGPIGDDELAEQMAAGVHASTLAALAAAFDKTATIRKN
jgi:methylmalonyl-CoA mutase N-terminal domain/subunit